MKIEKFNENNTFKYCYIVIEHDTIDRYYSFLSEKEACDFIVNLLYNLFRKNENILNELDNIENDDDIGYYLDTIADYYNNLADRYYNINKISTQEIKIQSFEFPNWIQSRRNAKKYNL